ncbi:MAG: hypothetical protein ACKO9G_28300, partial [Dolichospermum sp.]
MPNVLDVYSNFITHLKIAVANDTITNSPVMINLHKFCTHLEQLDSEVRFVGDTIDWDSESDIGEKIAKYSPRVIFQTASLQSPWDFLGASKPTRWKQLVWAAGNA